MTTSFLFSLPCLEHRRLGLMTNEPQPFFSTVKELQKWMRDHLVVLTLAAAAATAVSVMAITRPQDGSSDHEEEDHQAPIQTESTSSRRLSVEDVGPDGHDRSPHPGPTRSRRQAKTLSRAGPSPDWGWYVSTTSPEEQR